MAAAVPTTPRLRTRLGKKEKKALRDTTQPENLGSTSSDHDAASERPSSLSSQALELLPWTSLTDTTTTATCPVVFSPDSTYCFIASGSSVKIYSTKTTELHSTLGSPLPTTSTSAQASDSITRSKVTAVLLHPSNPLQLLVGSLDGTIRIWDYYEGKLLRTVDLGAPVLHACGHSSLPEHLFVALVAKDPEAQPSTTKAGDESEAASPEDPLPGSASLPLSKARKWKTSAEARRVKTRSASEFPKAGVYAISLRPKALEDMTSEENVTPTSPRMPSRRIRLAHPRIVRSLSLSPTGSHLLSLNPHAINICRTSQLQRGFNTQIDSTDALTALAFHPNEDSFATGDERGVVRLWYDALEEGGKGPKTSHDVTGAPKAARATKSTTAVYHWHRHPVSSLVFTPNGAYLLSGGEEAVMVLWQLHTGHNEFVPRLGAPVVALSITDDGQNEQQIAARLRDGSVVFIGSQRLKISKIISGLKSDPVRLESHARRPRSRFPLATQPSTNALVLPAAHPSSIQFFSPTEDTQLLELEISPSNRVSSASEIPIEPTRVERVTFSTPWQNSQKSGGSYWMATLDTWTKLGFETARHLKFWEHRSNGTRFALTTRIDQPHDAFITSMTFSPSATSPLLLTTSSDGLLKIWSFVRGAWGCRTSFTYRDYVPQDAVWSPDGSMFAVAHSRSVTLWSLASSKLIHAFACSSIAPVNTVHFAGDEGTMLIAGGARGTIGWDLLTFQEMVGLDFEVISIASKPQSSLFVAIGKVPSRKDSNSPLVTSTSAYLIDASTSLNSKAMSLPFAIRQAIWYEPGIDGTDKGASLAVVNERGDVCLVGDAAKVGSRVVPNKLARAAASKTQSKLFDQIYGPGNGVRSKRANESGAQLTRTTGASALQDSMKVLDGPAHSLPPVKQLWRSMLDAFAVRESNSSIDLPVGSSETDGMDVDEEDISSSVRFTGPLAFIESPDSLSDIFKGRFQLSHSQSAVSHPGSKSSAEGNGWRRS